MTVALRQSQPAKRTRDELPSDDIIMNSYAVGLQSPSATPTAIRLLGNITMTGHLPRCVPILRFQILKGVSGSRQRSVCHCRCRCRDIQTAGCEGTDESSC